MTYDAELADRIRAMLPGTPEKEMFGGLGFMVGGNMALAANSHGGLMVRCDPAESATLATEDGVDRMVMRGKAMDGWLTVDPSVAADEAGLARWVEVGTTYARSLPPK